MSKLTSKKNSCLKLAPSSFVHNESTPILNVFGLILFQFTEITIENEANAQINILLQK